MPTTPIVRTSTTSLPASASSPTALANNAARFAVRLKPQTETFTAYTLTAPTELKTVTGYEVAGRFGDYVITRGKSVVEVVSPAQFTRTYERVDEQGLTITGGHRTAIERVLGFGSTDTPEHLVTAIQRMAGLKIGLIDVTFTPSQWEELAHRAKKRGISVESLTKQIVDKLLADLWQNV